MRMNDGEKIMRRENQIWSYRMHQSGESLYRWIHSTEDKNYGRDEFWAFHIYIFIRLIDLGSYR